jgi:hypothetical protein
MTDQDFQDRLDALVADLQTKGKGQTVNVMFRNQDNSPNILPLSSDANGVVNAAQLQAIQNVVSELAGYAGELVETSAPVQAASEAFKTASAPHEALRIAAQTANAALRDALAGDPAYQAAKAALDNARANPLYVSVSQQYERYNVSENYAALGQAKGEYIV